MNDFQEEVTERVAAIPNDKDLCETAAAFMCASTRPKYSYSFTWQGRPIIQYPQDMVAMQEHTWKIKPDLIIEAGIARGGSITLSLSMLALLDMCDAIESGEKLDPKISHRKVLGDIIAQVQTTAKQHGLAWVQ